MWEKSETHLFFLKLQKLKLPSFIKGEGEGSNYEQFSNYLTSASEFSLMADNTTNIANWAQLAIFFNYVNSDMHSLMEMFLGLTDFVGTKHDKVFCKKICKVRDTN